MIRSLLAAHEQAEVVSRTFLDLAPGDKGAYHVFSTEPFALKALEAVMSHYEPEVAGAEKTQQLFQGTAEGKSENHGPLGELALELALREIGSINAPPAG